MDDKNQKEKTNLEYDAENDDPEPAEESLDSVVNKMRGLGLFDGVDDPYTELMRERGVEINQQCRYSIRRLSCFWFSRMPNLPLTLPPANHLPM